MLPALLAWKTDPRMNVSLSPLNRYSPPPSVALFSSKIHRLIKKSPLPTTVVATIETAPPDPASLSMKAAS